MVALATLLPVRCMLLKMSSAALSWAGVEQAQPAEIIVHQHKLIIETVYYHDHVSSWYGLIDGGMKKQLLKYN